MMQISWRDRIVGARIVSVCTIQEDANRQHVMGHARFARNHTRTPHRHCECIQNTGTVRRNKHSDRDEYSTLFDGH